MLVVKIVTFFVELTSRKAKYGKEDLHLKFNLYITSGSAYWKIWFFSSVLEFS